jgi:dTDP-4-amino-4,6-dideoxygalactose transaminase
VWGQAGVLSFFPTKTLGAFGDGGMVLTDDDDIAAAARRLRHHGRADSGAHVDIGHNSRLDEIQACVLLTRLDRLDDEIDRRAALAARYTAALADLAPLVRTPWLAPAREPSNQVWYVYLIECERRDALVEHLARQGIGTEVYYPRPLPAQPCLAGLAGSARPVPVAAAAARRAVALPLYPDLTEAQVDRVCAQVRSFYQEAA